MKAMCPPAPRLARMFIPLLTVVFFVSPAIAKKHVLTESVAEQDFGANGSIDQTATTTNTYNKHGDLIQTVTVITGTFLQTSTTTFTNNKHGNPLTAMLEVDTGSDGSIDLTSTTSFIYDKKLRIGFDQIVDNDGDSNPDIIRHQTTTYDGNDNPILTVTESDTDADGNLDGNPDQILTVQNTFSSDDRLLTNVTTFDQNADGDADDPGDSVNTRVNIFDSQGNVAAFITTIDSQNDGVIDAISDTTLTYGPHDRVIGLESEFDDNADGTIEQITTVTNTYDHL